MTRAHEIADDAPIRRPAYMNAARLAEELCVSESTVSELARRGVIPPPSELSSGCIRWRWADVDAALALRRRGGNGEPVDDLMAGAINAAKAAKEGRRRGTA
jgi:predicted DNA-binding transcriptional regulator AlpA